MNDIKVPRDGVTLMESQVAAIVEAAKEVRAARKVYLVNPTGPG